MSEEIIKVLDAICAKFGLAIDWTAANIMPYVQELMGRYISYEIATSIFYMILWPIIAVLFVIAAKISWPYAKGYDIEPDHVSSWIFIISTIGSIVFAISVVFVLITQAHDIITCMTLPEKQILDYLIKLSQQGYI